MTKIIGYSTLNEQLIIHRRELELADKEFKINEKIYSEKLISRLEFYREESKLLAKNTPIKNIQNLITNNISVKNAKKTEILELDNAATEQKSSFQQNLNSLLSSISFWKNRYLLISPTNGSVIFLNTVQEKQNISIGSEIMYVGNSGNVFFGEMKIPQVNFGKVKVGQKVIIKLESYPFEEYGMLNGVIASIAKLPSQDNSTFTARVKIPNGLKTNLNKNLTYSIGMTATAEIITEDLRLIERLFYQIRKPFISL